MSKFSYYTVGTTYLFDDLNDAAAAAAAGTSKYVVLANSGTLPAGDYTIPSGVTLVIPFDDSNTNYTEYGQWTGDQSTYVIPTAYRKLTMADGANITVASGGAMSVSGKYTYAAGGTALMVSGPVGMVEMNSGSTITVNGNLYTYGFIYGKGTVDVKSGGVVTELMQLGDCRGGTQTTSMENGVLPFSQYFVQNVEVPTTYHYGSKLQCNLTIYMSSSTFLTSACLVATESDEGLFRLTDGATLTKSYDGELDRTFLDIVGNCTLGSFKVTISGTEINTADYIFPLTNSWEFSLRSGTSTFVQEVATLPGSAVVVHEDATAILNAGARIYIYDADQWGTYCYSSEAGTDVKMLSVKYSPTKKYDRTDADLVDAKITVDGTLDASAGYLYTTESGADICSTGSGVVKINPGTETVTYQLRQTESTYDELPITSAQLKNGDGTYLKTAETGAGDYYYNKDHGKWVLGDHTITDEVTDPTCTEKGYTTHTCTCGESYTGNETDALGHDYEITESVAATCTEDGYITYTCKNDPTHTYTETLSHAGHSYEEVVTPPTCTAEGYTTYTCAACGDSYTDDTVAATGHNHVGTVTTEPTCTTDGLRTFTCSVCGDSYTEAITATGHTPGAAATCTTAQTCTVCGAELVAAGHKYEDNVCTVCHHAFNDSMQAFLKLENAVVMGVGFKLDAVTTETQGAALTGRVGLLIWDAANELTEEKAVVGNNACQQLTNTTYNGERFEVLTDGIPAKNLGDAVAFRAYYKKTDNTYVYSRIIDSYSPKQYCYNKLAATDEESAALHPLMIAILNYCTAAQEYFASKPDIYGYTITERINSGLTDAQKTLNWNGSLVRSDWSISKEGALTRDAEITSRGGNLTLKGAINYTYYFKTSLTNVKSAQILTWTEEEYNAADVLTEDNATVSELEWVDDNSRYEYVYAGLPAKDMFSPIYACAKFTDSDGNVYYSGVIAYCPERFSSINQSNTDSYLAALAKWIVIYGDAARTYFADK